jgi:hypothetical protein
MANVGSNRKPVADRPLVPDGYGVPESNENLLPWSYVEERMQAARNYWIGTANREGKPAATPVWGAWIDGKLYFDGSAETRRGRNITENPKVVVHLESGDQVVILEGEAVILTGAPERDLAVRLSEAYTAKYGGLGYSPGPESWDGGGLFVFTPEKAMGWAKFPEDLTRWSL